MGKIKRKALIPPARQMDLIGMDTDGCSAFSNPVKLLMPEFFIRRSAPVPSIVFSTYWRFAKARQNIFFEGLFGDADQSSEVDWILRRHKFTNVYRASDRVSQYLIRHVIYNDNWSAIDILFRTLIFKFFNKIETWETLEREVGAISWKTYSFERYDRCLSNLMACGKTIYSAAYIMPSGRSAFGFERKHRNHLKIIESLIESRVPDRMAQKSDLASVYRLLREFPCIGPFVGYQLAIDLNYSPLLDFSEDDFVEPGPGALDGISKCFSSLGDYTPTDIIRYMTDIQERAFEQCAPDFEPLWGRRLHLIDCQNLFCEVGKYARVAHPEIPGHSGRTRIKQVYRQSSRKVELPWYPPKWGINEKITSDPRWCV